MIAAAPSKIAFTLVIDLICFFLATALHASTACTLDPVDPQQHLLH